MIARFWGRCAGCPDDIIPGDYAEYVDGVIHHADCAPIERKDPPLCPDCFIMHAGECP